MAAVLLATLLLGSVLARGSAPAELSDLTAGALPTAAPAAVSMVPVAAVTTSLPQPAPAWVRRTSAASGVSRPALRAYARAVIVVAREQPRCHLGWTTLAGIGWVESQNGTVDGRLLGADGVPVPAITGPVLDGTTYAAVPDGVGGWAHAQGPMQFVPSTWASWAADGDGDGRADVDDLDDAALAAGRYLCADGHDLATGAGWTAAVFSYNHDNAYVNAVYSAATSYDAREGR